MPQMAPLWWELLYIMFLLSFMTMVIIVYYNKNFKYKNNTSNKKVSQLNWKW